MLVRAASRDDLEAVERVTVQACADAYAEMVPPEVVAADARKRFIIGMVADRLEGPWERITDTNDDFFGHAINLFNEDGSKSSLTQVSHPELIRSGYDQKLEIESFDIDMLFQSFDGSVWPDSYNAFHQARSLVWEGDFDAGWLLFHSREPLQFGAGAGRIQ